MKNASHTRQPIQKIKIDISDPETRAVNAHKATPARWGEHRDVWETVQRSSEDRRIAKVRQEIQDNERRYYALMLATLNRMAEGWRPSIDEMYALLEQHNELGRQAQKLQEWLKPRMP
jgi:hypothetical protein